MVRINLYSWKSQTGIKTSHAVTSNVPLQLSIYQYAFLLLQVKAQSTHDSRTSQSGSKAVKKGHSSAKSTCSAYTNGAQYQSCGY